MRNTLPMLATFALLGCGGADTTDVKRVTLAPGSFGAASIDIATDGRISFEKVLTGRSAIFVADAAGSNTKRVSFGVWDFGPRWSPDGKWILTSRDAGLQSDLVIVPSDSGADVLVAETPVSEFPLGWFPDASGVLYGRVGARGLRAVEFRLASKASTVLIDVPGITELSASPDGNAIAYTVQDAGKSTLWLWERSTKARRQLTTEGFESIGIRSFSPDGRRIVFESRRTGTADLWALDVATGERKQLTQDVADDTGAEWSPDGSRIAFNSNRGSQPDIWVISAGESDVQRVTDDALLEFVLRWTIAGDAVIASVASGHQHLYSLPTAGGAATQLTTGDWDVGGAELSRDGDRVVYSGSKNGDSDIWIVSVGGESRLVSGAPGTDDQASFSPDGRQVVFTSVRSGNRDVWVASADSASATARQLTNWPSSEGGARWSPDGKWIAFVSTRESTGPDIWVMPATGGAPRRLTRLATIQGGGRWNPDSRTIAFTAIGPGAEGTASYTISAIGGEPRLFLPPASSAREWSPDGSLLGITKCVRGYCNIETRDRSGKLVSSLSPAGDNYDFLMTWSHDGKQVAVVSQDLSTNAVNRTFLRPATGGIGRQLTGPFDHAVAVGFAAGDRAVIVAGAPYGAAIQQISIPGKTP